MELDTTHIRSAPRPHTHKMEHLLYLRHFPIHLISFILMLALSHAQSCHAHKTAPSLPLLVERLLRFVDVVEVELLVLSNSLSQEEAREGLLLSRSSIPGPLPLENPKLPWSSKGLSRYLVVKIGVSLRASCLFYTVKEAIQEDKTKTNKNIRYMLVRQKK